MPLPLIGSDHVEVILAATLLVLIAVIMLAGVAGFVSLAMDFLLLFRPAITGMALAIVRARAGADTPAAICVFGGVLGNVTWWDMPRSGGSALAFARWHRKQLQPQLMGRAKPDYSGQPRLLAFGTDDLSALGVDPDARRLFLWTARQGLVHVIDGQEVICARVLTRPPGEESREGQLERIDLQLTLRHPRLVVPSA